MPNPIASFSVASPESPDGDRLFQSLFEHSADGVLVSRPDGRIVRANPAACRLLGRTEAEICALGRSGLVVPEPHLESMLRERLRSGVVHGELTFARPDGTHLPCEITSALIPTTAGDHYAFIVFRDVTERNRARAAQRAAEAAFRESEARFRTVFEHAAVGIARVGLDGRFLEVNPAYADLVGYSVEELTELGFPAITHPDDLEPDLENARALIASERSSYTMEKRYVRKDGSVVWVTLSGSLFRDERGQPVYFIAVVTDLTARRNAEAALREADQRKSEFLAVLSHELRNPLAPIRNSVAVLDRAPAGSPVAARAKDVIHRQTDHLTRLVDDLLDVTRISRGKIDLSREQVDVSEVVRKAADDHHALLERNGLTLRVDVPAVPLWADADPTRLAQVVGNLLHNAGKFTPVGGTITVALAARGAQAEITVRDTGVGIDASDLERIFEPFAQGDQGLARTRGGLGLGLALVKGLVELHGGTVRARSEGRDRGAELVVTIPLLGAPESADADADARGGATVGRRVLVIEDNADAARSLADCLELEGHRVELAHDARTGIARALALRPDVVLCDIGLPDQDGYAVARALRAAGVTAKLVALTGHAAPEDRRRATDAGFDAHLPKPPTIDGLLALVGDPP